MKFRLVTLLIAAGALLAAAPVFAAEPNSCEDSCGGQSQTGECWCDEACFGIGDCCTDICEMCPEFVGVMEECTDLSNCGDGNCDPAVGEGCTNCDADCVCPEGDVCADNACCTPDCEGKECGLDGCGGECDACGDGLVCIEEFCEEVPLCEAPFTIECGDVVQGDTTNFESLIDLYECVSWDEAGPEVAYIFSPSVDDVVTAALSDLVDADLDILITQGECSAYTCIDSGNSSTEFVVEAGETYYIVVDGFGGDAGPFTLSVGCDSLCGDGECDGETCETCPEDCACPEGDVCTNGVCCTPSCEGLDCGDDGCGGNCGVCEVGVCSEGVCLTGPGCESTPVPGCGGCPCEACVCEMDPFCCETAWDGLCVGECLDECGGCPVLENCGNGVCDVEEGENCASCVEDCACPEGDVCTNGVCCTPSCEGLDCGDDGCGGNCGDCGDGFICSEGLCEEFSGLTQCLGLNEPSAAGCDYVEMYEGCCDPMGRVVWCDQGSTFCIDCAGLNPECGWQGEFYDCGTDGSAEPTGTLPKECVPCDPPCEDGFKCEDGECVECIPECDGIECGDNGCGGTCGNCPAGAGCIAGTCMVAGCEEMQTPGCGGCPCEGCVCEIDPYCCQNMWDGFCVGACLDECGGCPEIEHVCGDDFCGGTEDCTSCLEDCPCDGDCVDGECVECAPDCDGLECGDDGCGGSCGDCEDGLACVDGMCIECTPNCDGVECGDDGCGGDCGACDDGLYCDFGTCTAGSCDGYCGFEEVTPFGCFCDDACFEYDDCCPDVCEMCPDLVNCDCMPDCTETECGDDGCGGDCGACDDGFDCIDGACIGEVVDPCEPNPCMEPPMDYCDADGITLVSYVAEGICTLDDAGAPVCEYTEQTLDCSAQDMACDVDKCTEAVTSEDLGGGEEDVVSDADPGGEEDTGTGGGGGSGDDCSTGGTGNPNTVFLLLGFILALTAIRRFRFTA